MRFEWSEQRLAHRSWCDQRSQNPEVGTPERAACEPNSLIAGTSPGRFRPVGGGVTILHRSGSAIANPRPLWSRAGQGGLPENFVESRLLRIGLL